MPSWYAIAALSDARDATEHLLRPLDRGLWLRLAVISLFVGVGGGVPIGGGNASVPSGGGGMSEMPTQSLSGLSSEVAAVVAILAVLLAFVLLWNLVGAVMEFVLVRGLRDRTVTIREPFGDSVGSGLRLFGFRIAVGLGTLLFFAVPLLLVVVGGLGLSAELFLLVIPLLAALFIIGLVTSVILGVTTDFVVPTMLTEGRGVLDGWRRLWPTLRAEWKQVLVYLVAKFVLGIAISIAVSIATVLVAIALAIPFVIVGGALYLAVSAVGVGHAVLVVVPLVALFVLALVVASLLIQAPALAFVRYYSLSVLGMLLPELDLVGVDRPGDDGDDDDGDGGPDAGDDDDDDGDGDEGPDAGDDDGDTVSVGGFETATVGM
jgi:hypothetical protein